MQGRRFAVGYFISDNGPAKIYTGEIEMTDIKITDGYMPFHGYKTYFRIAGDLAGSDKTPLLLLHGGPGSTHNYFELLDPLSKDGRPVISYDQIGCGNSYLDGHPELWKAATWIEELTSLREYLHLDHLHLLGQSWGGMLAIEYLIEKKPAGVRSVILSSTLSSSRLWSREQHRRIAYLSPEDREAIRKAEETGDYTAPAYLAANEHFMERHCCGPFKDTDPECLRRPKRSGTEAYLTAWGPNEYTPTGTLRDFDYTDRLGEIRIPALIISGTDDLCSPLVAKTMYDRLPDAKWELFEGCRHMCYADDTPRYLDVLGKWMEEKDPGNV